MSKQKVVLRGVFAYGGADKAILVPLTTSLYVPGTLADSNNVLVEIGTGYYVEKVRATRVRKEQVVTPSQSTVEANKFYNGKIDELATNLKDLESIVQGKSNNQRVVEDGGFSFHDPAPMLIPYSITTKSTE